MANLLLPIAPCHFAGAHSWVTGQRRGASGSKGVLLPSTVPEVQGIINQCVPKLRRRDEGLASLEGREQWIRQGAEVVPLGAQKKGLRLLRGKLRKEGACFHGWGPQRGCAGPNTWVVWDRRMLTGQLQKCPGNCHVLTSLSSCPAGEEGAWSIPGKDAHTNPKMKDGPPMWQGAITSLQNPCISSSNTPQWKLVFVIHWSYLHINNN